MYHCQVIAFVNIFAYYEDMDGQTKAFMFEQGGKLIGNVAKLVMKRSSQSDVQETTITKTPDTPKSSTDIPKSSDTGIVTRKNNDESTIAYQEQKLYSELWLTELHAKEDFIGCSTDVHCGFKHGLDLVALVDETKSMTSDPIFQKIESLGNEIQVKAYPDRVKEGTHHQEYQELAVRIGELRKEMMYRVMARRKPAITLEQAKKQAADEAAKRVEEKWRQGDANPAGNTTNS